MYALNTDSSNNLNLTIFYNFVVVIIHLSASVHMQIRKLRCNDLSLSLDESTQLSHRIDMVQLARSSLWLTGEYETQTPTEIQCLCLLMESADTGHSLSALFD